MVQREFNVLFLCTGNSARSVMAECALNRWGRGKFRGFSAGSHPKDEIHPMTLTLLHELNYETSGLRSKSWDEFAQPGSPQLDFVFTVCDNAAKEACPVWPGQPITAHWGAADPVAFVGGDEQKRRFFLRVYTELENRIKMFTSLPMDSLDRFDIERRVKEIGKVKPPDDASR
jgi:protein-tyrosine-phosphatase